MRRSGRHQDRITGLHRDAIHRAENLRAVLVHEPRTQLGGLDLAVEAEIDVRVRIRRPDDDPGLGLPERRSEVDAGKRAIGMAVHRQALAGVEQLHQERGVGTEAGDVRGAEELFRVGRDSVAEQLAVRQSGGAVQAAELRQCGRDPVLGCAGRVCRERRARLRVRSRWLAAEGLDLRPAQIELLRLVCGQADWLHQVTRSWLGST